MFLGDVFGYYYGQEEILSALRKSGYICLRGNHDEMFLELLNGKRNLDVLCMRYGSSYRRNLRSISDENIEFLKHCPTQWQLERDGIRIGAFHGSPDAPMEGRVYPDTDIPCVEAYAKFDYVFLGHTHHNMVRTVGHTTVINPGSVGQQRDGKGSSFTVFDTADLTIRHQCFTYDLAPLVNEIEQKDPQNEKLLEVLFRKM